MDFFKEIENMHKTMRKMQEDMDKMFAGFSDFKTPLLPDKSSKALAQSFRMPKTEIKETSSLVIATIELPGVEKKNIELHVSENYLEIKAKQETKKEVKKKSVQSYATSSSQFYRRLPLPTAVKPNKAHAEYKNGILKVEMTKEKNAASKKISIK